MGPVSGRGARSRAAQVLVAAFWLVAACYSSAPSSCRPPCETASCINASTANCPYGRYPTCQGCCYRCAIGPGRDCADDSRYYESCGEGLVCIGASDDDPLNYPGQCRWREDATSAPTTQLTEPVSPTPSPTPSPSPTNPESGYDMPVRCKVKCSPSNCFRPNSTKKRVCSAEGLAPVVPERNRCQHTSCAACYVLREPDCSSHACTQPPSKRCLNRFSQCIRSFHSDTATILVPLLSQAALNTAGRIICHVPEVLTSTGSQGAAGSQDSGDGYQGESSTSGGGH